MKMRVSSYSQACSIHRNTVMQLQIAYLGTTLENRLYLVVLTTTPCLYSTKSKSPDSTLYFLRSVFQSSCGCKEIWIKTRKWTLDNTWNNCTKVSTSMQDGHMKRPSTLYIKVNEVSDGSARNMAHNILFDRLRTIANRSLNVKLNH